MPNQDRISEAYKGEIWDTEKQAVARARIDWMCSQAAGRTLDLGCSQGIASILLGRAGVTVFGVDHEFDRLEYAVADLSREEGGIQERVSFLAADGTQLPFADKTFDTVLLGEILEHLIAPEELLEEVRRVIVPNGRVVVTTPFGYNPFHDHKETFYPWSLVNLITPLFRPIEIDMVDKYIRLIATAEDDVDSRPAAERLVLDAQPRLEEAVLLWEKELLALKLDLKDKQDVENRSRILEDKVRDLEEQCQLLEARVRDAREQVSAWRSRAEEAMAENERLHERIRTEKADALRSEITALESQRDRLLVTGRLRRLRARRWWKLGEALGRWRRSPWRVVRLIGELWSMVVSQEALPLLADVASVEDRLEELRAELEGMSLVSDAQEAFQAGEYERCLEILEAASERVRRSRHALLLARSCYIKLGEVTQALSSVRQAIGVANEPALRRQARTLAGMLQETNPRWLPEVGMPVEGDVEPSPGVMLHILKESLPFFERGYTMRSQMTLTAQRRAGFYPTVVTSLGFPRDQGFDDFPMEESIDGIVHHRLDLGPSYKTAEIPNDQVLSDQAMLTARLARKIRPSIIQAGSGYRGYETALVGLAVARYLSVPMIYEIRSFLEHTWTAEFHRSEQGEYYQRRHDQEMRCLEEADFVVTIAESMRQEIIGRGIPAEKIEVVPNVVDVERFTPRRRSRRLAKRYGLDGRVVLGYISNLGAREGIENLIQAVGILRNGGLEAAGLVVGDGPERQRLEGLVAELGLEDHMVLTGHVPNKEIEDHYALIDLFVIPRINDRAARLVSPLKPLEAMAMGVPVIAADLPALRELVSPGERGEVFTPADPMSLAEVAGGLLSDEDARSRFAANARGWVLAERTIEANAARYQKILSGVLAAR